MQLEYILKNEDNNLTINQIIQREYNFSNRLFTKLLKNNLIFLNNKNIDTRLSGNLGDTLKIDLNYPEESENIVPTEMSLDILYEDEAILALNKPAGIATHPSILHYDDSLSNGVKFYFDSINLKKKIRPINRLDYNTSGIILFAKNEYVQECLIRQMGTPNFIKQYLALVEGTFNTSTEIIDAPIARKENSIIERCISKNGQKAITQYEVLNTYTTYSLVKCTLLTGRTHQIRLHMAHIGHPILGDTLYGDKNSTYTRQALHSYYISFIHPITKQKIEIISPIDNFI